MLSLSFDSSVCDWSGAVQNRAEWTRPYQIDQDQIVPDWSGPICTRLTRTKLYQIRQQGNFQGVMLVPLKDYNDQMSHSSVQLDFQMFINIFLLVLKYSEYS